MANELNISYTGSNTVYAVIQRLSDGYAWNGSAFETWADGNIGDYDIPLSSLGGDLYGADFPTDIDEGTKVRITYYMQDGANPATDDYALTSEEKTWTGAALSAGSDAGSYPVTLAEVKLHLRIDSSTEDNLLNALISTAVSYAENWLERTLLTTARTYYLQDWPNGEAIYIPYPPLQSVTSVVYTDTDGTANTFSSDNYNVETTNSDWVIPYIKLKYNKSWPTATLKTSNPIAISYSAGYGDNPSDVPRPIRNGILLFIGTLYENRETVVPYSYNVIPTVEWLWTQYKAMFEPALNR